MLAYLDKMQADDAIETEISSRLAHLASAPSEPHTDAGAMSLAIDAADQLRASAAVAVLCSVAPEIVIVAVAAVVAAAAAAIAAHCTSAVVGLALVGPAAVAADSALEKTGAVADGSEHSAVTPRVTRSRAPISGVDAAPYPYLPIAKRFDCHNSVHIVSARIANARLTDPVVKGISRECV